jgi:hypothetical protein
MIMGFVPVTMTTEALAYGLDPGAGLVLKIVAGVSRTGGQQPGQAHGDSATERRCEAPSHASRGSTCLGSSDETAGEEKAAG